jgi:long-chain fatty acid transport protein
MIKRNLIHIAIFHVIAYVISSTTPAFSGGFAVPQQTAKAAALSNALTAGVDDPSAVYINPAGLAFVDGNQILANMTYINAISNVKNSGQTSRNLHDDNFIPTLFANYHIPGTDVTLGLGTYTPFGLATTYKDDAFTRFAAIRSELKLFYVSPTVSWQPVPYFSVGGGASFVHSSEVLSRKLFLGAVDVGEARLRITDTDDAFGYHLGILAGPFANFKFGLSYRSRIDLSFNNADVKFTDAAFTGGAFTVVRGKGLHVPIPPVISAGIHWQISPEWGAEFDYNFTRWSEFERLKLNFPTPLPALGGAFPITQFVVPQNWKNTSTLRLGITYKVTSDLELRAGMALDEAPAPSSSLSPAIPTADIFAISGGFGYHWDTNLKIEFGYMALFYKNRNVTNNVLEGTNVVVNGGVPTPAFPGAPGPDKYEIFNNFLSFNLRYRF